MKFKNRILLSIFIVFLCGWTCFIVYIHKSLVTNFTLGFENTSQAETLEISVLIDKNKKSLISISDDITNLIFDDKKNTNYSITDVTQKIDKLWGVFNKKHKLMSLSYYDSTNNLVKSWGPLKNISENFTPKKENTKAAFENTKGIGYFSCEETCYYNTSKKIHPNSFGYGILNLSIPIDNILYSYSKTNILNLIFLYSSETNSETNSETTKISLNNIELKKISPILSQIIKYRYLYFIKSNKIKYFIYKINYSKYPNTSFIIYREITNDLIILEITIYKIILGSLLLVLILFGVLYLLLHQRMLKLQLLDNILPDIGIGDFDIAKKRLENTSEKKHLAKNPDEIDNIWSSIKILNEKLQYLHQKLHQKNQELEKIASIDSMTNIFNRRKFTEKVTSTIEITSPFFLINIDINKFKFINDTFGHAEGDLLLIQVAEVLKKTIGENDYIGRMGGDEFAILIHGKSKKNLNHILEDIVKKIARIKIGKQSISLAKISLAIGTVRYPHDSTNLKELNSFADAAMYENKKDQKYPYNYFIGNERILEKERKVNYWVQFISASLENDLIIPFFQPVFHAKSKKIFSYEVLARINEKDSNTPLSADNFICYAEDTDLIVKIDHAIIKKAVSYAANHTPSPTIMINISHQTLISPDIENYILEQIYKNNFPISNVILEITESSEIKNFQPIKNKITFLRSKGIRFALDDFGSGYASFNYISNLPLDFIKIDYSIVNKLLHEGRTSEINCQILKSVINIAKTMPAKIIVEGIESLELINKINEFDVDMLQGYFFERPQSGFSK